MPPLSTRRGIAAPKKAAAEPPHSRASLGCNGISRSHRYTEDVPSLSEKLEGAMWGLLVGDALGVPYEFHHPSTIPPIDEIELDPPAGFSRSHSDVPPGTWSDDGAQALCLLASLQYCGKVDVEDLMRRLTNWYELGYMAAGGLVFDIGIQTSVALRSFRAGTPAAECGPRGERDNGNGSLMRVLPLALWHI